MKKIIDISDKHISVQKENFIKYLKIKPNGIYVDATFGRGGHSLEILKSISDTNSLLISIDKDEEAFEFYKTKFPKYPNHIFVNDSFSNLESILAKNRITNVDGFIFDLGVSSPQLDNDYRGFSFLKDSFLDMRMSQNLQEKTAFDIVNTYTLQQLISIFKKYGEINNSYKVANAICTLRDSKPIKSTLELVEIISNNIPKKELYGKKHFARKYFQAIRMEVNNEIDEIKIALNSAMNILSFGGVIITLSFHSLEEKTIKMVYRNFETKLLPKEIPINNLPNEYKIKNIDSYASFEEIKNNPRARSSRMKVIERVKYE
ncbi:MAG: 16S rRNA (cytosine(1402)-N(4))-methyltransferase RsmH [Malacoplasma sp.]